MLNLSANGDYGLLLLKELSLAQPGQYLSLATLARTKHLPRKYLDHVARQLVTAGVISAREGRGGGYILSKPVNQIKFVEVLKALEGELEPVHCTHDGKCCDRKFACERKTGWQEVHAQLYKLLQNKTLADVIKTAA
ncbi:MAG: Transcriptional regulator, BadM/Rrf2 family [Parcubacteria group bacterium GW2011_GWD2_43_10]|uniref:Rrf2 family transcriptional regulator n=5 Tax=Candidatus Vebleniibacteriota TaxID=1817921 RepID=A0A1G2Q6S0_9BACT|nr:MAG: Transcriptional regulator, BadM/Rrf2 family [Parcubacteria group bacterium GW2011_GWA2_42_80]KKS79267.1 MAG: Transcriptional regulator, BadM/Rrf2 family [Parcubacteria group bacterium GW2011_GWD1_42_9]KKS83987.1 MAG: Transcriptional regulator, BadM/Rrf2 family [Parcubacteria group bacterium GW2011_GWD2_43_10]KKS94131.1 MAG: Transcriptional regulator, BadM/Rrf2 family [Parcubacteria group bacterium GW2011_GWE2_43_12]KKT14023.1 MAG: Transcriptional regulator, BadM/Rrf2 family [Parcubacter